MDWDFKQQTFELIKSFAGEKKILAIPTAFIEYCDGDIEIGLFLSQLIYLCDKGSRDDGYIYKSNKEWEEEYYLTDYTVRKSKKYLEKDKGIIKTKLIKANGSPTTHYKLLKDKFTKSFLQFLKYRDSLKSTNGNVENNKSNLRKQQNHSLKSTNGNVENNKSLTEITTEITSKSTTDINNNKKKRSYEKFKEAFGSINKIQKRKISNYKISNKLLYDTIENVALGGHNPTFLFNKLDDLKNNDIKNKKDLKKHMKIDNNKDDFLQDMYNKGYR